ncbi:MAG: V-type ATP synthase subunit E family protein [Candidatus Micrarchaeota archaeon]
MPKVAQQITEGAKKEAAEILAKAETEANGIERESENMAKKKAQEILREAEQTAIENKKQILAQARLSVKQAEVEQKNELVMKIFEEAIDKLSKISLSKVFPKKLLVNPPANSQLFVAKRDLAWAKKNFKGEVLEADILGGYMLESGNKRINNSFEVILAGLKDEFSQKAVKSIKKG